MKKEQLFEAIGEVKAEYLEESEQLGKKQPKVWGKWTALAACACLIVGLGAAALFLTRPAPTVGQIPGGRPSESDTSPTLSPSTPPASEEAASPAEAPSASPGQEPASNDGKGGEGSFAEGDIFLSYAGPVFPLTVQGNAKLDAERNIDLDFAPYAVEQKSYRDEEGNTHFYEVYDPAVTVTDQYVLTNTGTEDLHVQALYPYASDFMDWDRRCPAVFVDGKAVSVRTQTGSYIGGYYSVDEERNPGERWNIRAPQSWQDYQQALYDGSYLAQALQSASLSELPVTTYTLTDAQAPEGQAITLAIHAAIDTAKTTVLSYRFNGYGYNEETGVTTFDLFVRHAIRDLDKDQPLLLVIGEDLPEFTVQGYENGACETAVDGVQASFVREETTLGAVLRRLSRHYLCNYTHYDEYEHAAPTQELIELFARCLNDYLYQDGPLSQHPAERYATWMNGGRLDDVIGDAHSRERVFYAAFDVSIPAGQSVTVSVRLCQPHSFNFFGSGVGNEDVDGYDMVTRLGSSLNFTTLTASLQTHDLVEIVRQNYGFDPENGVNTVELEPTTERYFLQVAAKNGAR